MLESLTKEELIEQLHAVSGNVTREGGVSWSEAWALDYRENAKGLAAARARDLDQNWMEVANDTNWHVTSLSSAWSFLDDIGFRYYVAAAIARDLIFDIEVLDESFYRHHSFVALEPSELTFVANYILYKAELPTRIALMAVLDEADMTYDQYLQSEESWWTPEPVWSEWLEPLKEWRQYLPPKL